MIKKFNQSQIDEVMEIWLKTNIQAHGFIEKMHWENVFEDVKAALPSADIFAYEEDGKIKAFIGITDGQYIAGLFVLQQYQSQGIGRQLLDHCKGLYGHLELDVFTANQGAVEFYKRNGFGVRGRALNPEFQQEEYHMIWGNVVGKEGGIA